MMTQKNEPQSKPCFALPDRVHSLAIILRSEFGVPFRFYDSRDGRELPVAEPGAGVGGGSGAERAWVVGFGASEQSGVSIVPAGAYRLAIALHERGRPAFVAVGVKESVARPHPDAIREETVRLEKWLGAVFERLRVADQAACRHRNEPAAKPAATADAWEVVVRLEQLMRVQKTHKEPAKNRKRALRAAAELVPAQSLVFVPTKAAEPVIPVGEELLSPWDCGQLASLIARSQNWEEAGYLLCNDPPSSGWAARFPQVTNLLALPVLDDGPMGWLIALNKKGSPPASGGPVPHFRRTDAAMLAPFASLLGYHARAFRSYSHLKELLVGLTRSLTAAIDAKDSYTFGHSERVARVAVELGRELGLAEDELSDIYLAGLLHDIGKIGIRDEVLRKLGALDEAEFEHIKEHVKIGYRILSGLTSISHLLPGVLYHHERYDGHGYPDGLRGAAIPFIARILAVADSYDAMSTSRPYRVALPCDQVERTLVDGAGTQWDKAVVDAFVRCKEHIHAVRQRGVGESLCGALDDALSKGSGRQSPSSIVSVLVS
jgi:HD-GYP domain-containing protein (c-di-GMP phosphodiesterase class II)